jgi:2-polyprenyl-3-methyl-5-hydroxy-6-metoxy-1,4-benzoquinol methylase
MNWFDTKFYHILYKNRDHKEAELFIENLINKLKIKKNSKVLDLACGRGRHSIFLNKKGMIVSGFDSSENNILEVKKNNTKNLKFYKKEMDKSYNDSFDVIFNLFTSFGYFENPSDNRKVIDAVHTMLEDDGILVIDFMNVQKTMQNLVHEEQKTVEGITFAIERKIQNKHICKTIHFEDNGEKFTFHERVQAITMLDFEILFDSKFRVLNVFGSYALEKFNERDSDRLILIAQKY